MLKDIRKEKGWSIRELARRSGIPYRTIENWEHTGIEQARAGKLKKVTDALGCTIDDLFSEHAYLHQ